jgi:hypothetical protein
VNQLNGKLARVLDHDDDDGAGPRQNTKSQRNHGIASYHLLNGIPEHQWY